jgi:hypothetical protein
LSYNTIPANTLDPDLIMQIVREERIKRKAAKAKRDKKI